MQRGLVRLTVATGAVGLLLWFDFVDLEVLRDVLERPGPVVAAVVLLLATVPLAAYRWWLLLHRLDLTLGYMLLLRTTFVGQFCNTFLPGAYGGDLVRATLAYREARAGLSRITFSLVADRLSGLVALLFLGLMMLPAFPGDYRQVVIVAVLVAVCVIVAGVATGLRYGERAAGWLGSRSGRFLRRVAGFLVEIVGSLRSYLENWRLMAGAVLLSIIQFVLVLSALTLVGRAMEFDLLSVWGYLVAGVWALVANALPLTPGGVGIGEAAFAEIAEFIESAPSGASYATAFLAHRMLVALVSLVGLVPFRTSEPGDLEELLTIRSSEEAGEG
jgi:uncharacterized protein (TIRG00374 family)